MTMYPNNEIEPVEAAIMRDVIARAFEAGCNISVGDGEEFPLTHSTDAAAIMEASGSTEETIFVLYLAYGAGTVTDPIRNVRIGFIHFIHGNGEDVLSDCTDSPLIVSIAG